jgi:hypothetical protein
MSKATVLERLVQILSSALAGKVLGDLDKKIRDYVTDIVQKVAKKLMIMVTGVTIALIGSLFMFVAFAKYLNEIMHSTWMGWGVGGLVTLAIGLVIYALSRR